jgi:hypothetical protein
MLEDVADLSVTTRSAYHCSLMTGSTTGPRVTPRSSRPIHSVASRDGGDADGFQLAGVVVRDQ